MGTLKNDTLKIQFCGVKNHNLKNLAFFFTKLNIYVIFVYIIYFNKMTPEAERFNGWAAMLGFVAAMGAYVTTGQIIPGWF